MQHIFACVHKIYFHHTRLLSILKAKYDYLVYNACMIRFPSFLSIGCYWFCITSSFGWSVEKLEDADAFFSATLYTQAIPIYVELLQQDLEPATSFHVSDRLATSYLLLEDYPAVISVLKGHMNEAWSSTQQEGLKSLLARAYNKIKQPDLAIALLENEPLKTDEARFELAYALFQEKRFLEAKQAFAPVLVSDHSFHLKALAHFYCARISLEQQNPEEALTFLESLSTPKEDLLNKEHLYLKGECYFQQQNYLSAIQNFQTLLSNQQAPWNAGVLYYLGLSYLQLVDSTTEPNIQCDLFSKAEQALQQLVAQYPSEKGALALGQCYLKRAKELNDCASYGQAEKILSSDIFVTQNGKAHALLLRVEAAYYQHTQEKDQEALALLETLKSDPSLIAALESPDELSYLYVLIDLKNGKQELAKAALQEVLNLYPHGKYAEKNLLLLGTLYYQEKEYSKAEEVFQKLIDTCPLSTLAGEALFWSAHCAKQQGEDQKSRDLYRQVFEKYPSSSFAPEAYFILYSYRDYVQGDRAALKHLESFLKSYPLSPFAIHAWYLIGMDCKHDRKSPEGRWVRKKNLIAAIDAFQEAESTFDILYNQHRSRLMDASTLEQLIFIRYRSSLERALANLEIAEGSQGAKRRIYLEYAEDVFQQLLNELKDPQHPLRPYIAYQDTFQQLEKEASFWLAQAYLKAGQERLADEVLGKMLKEYQDAKITRGYILSRSWYEKARIAMCQGNYNQAIQELNTAEDAAKGNILSPDQKIDLWIQKSHCYLALGDSDRAILVLSTAINDSSLSSLRIQAMYHRAEIYERQGRRELARKQFEATSRKGGEWGLKAKKQLDEKYGY